MQLFLITLLFTEVKEQFLQTITVVWHISQLSVFVLHFINHIVVLLITEFLILSFLVLPLV